MKFSQLNALRMLRDSCTAGFIEAQRGVHPTKLAVLNREVIVRIIFAAFGAIMMSASISMAQSGDQLKPSAMNQAGELLASKGSLTEAQKKLDTQLLKVIPPQSLSDQARKLLDVEAGKTQVSKVDVDIALTEAKDISALIVQSGGDILENHPNELTLRARIPSDQLEAIAGSPDVRSIATADQPYLKKFELNSPHSDLNQAQPYEGDIALAAAQARKKYSVTGAGVTICVLSDGVAHLDEVQKAGHLPQVEILRGQEGPADNTGEGTAMLEIVHSLAPGSKLKFATAYSTQPAFAANIRGLQASGCRVIVDDVGYFREPVFQDGVVAQAVADVVASGVQYYSSAGNSGHKSENQSGVWEGEFKPAPLPPALSRALSSRPGFEGAKVHDFGNGNPFNRINQAGSIFTLQWADPWGKSGNDYDLLLLDPTLSQVVAASINSQNGTGDPYEQIPASACENNNKCLGYALVIVKKASAQPRFLHVNTNRGRLQISTDGQTSGHSAAEGAFSVAAIDVAQANHGAFALGRQYKIEQFSSDGPRRVYYDKNGKGTATNASMRRKVDLTSADGVRTFTPGFDPFYGTSAAAPHAAAIGALALSLRPALTLSQIGAIYERTALRFKNASRDPDTGVGLVLADTVLEQVKALGADAPQTSSTEAANDSDAPTLAGQWMIGDSGEILSITEGGRWLHPAHGVAKMRPAGDSADLKVFYEQGGVHCSYRIAFSDKGATLNLSAADRTQDSDYCPEGALRRIGGATAASARQ